MHGRIPKGSKKQKVCVKIVIAMQIQRCNAPSVCCTNSPIIKIHKLNEIGFFGRQRGAACICLVAISALRLCTKSKYTRSVISEERWDSQHGEHHLIVTNNAICFRFLYLLYFSVQNARFILVFWPKPINGTHAILRTKFVEFLLHFDTLVLPVKDFQTIRKQQNIVKIVSLLSLAEQMTFVLRPGQKLHIKTYRNNQKHFLFVHTKSIFSSNHKFSFFFVKNCLIDTIYYMKMSQSCRVCSVYLDGSVFYWFGLEQQQHTANEKQLIWIVRNILKCNKNAKFFLYVYEY